MLSKSTAQITSQSAPRSNPALSPAERAAALVAQMTLEEKILQMVHNAPAIERLGVPAHNWWNECLHGVARAGRATVFPQAIGMAASFDDVLLHRVAEAISDEARAKHHDAGRRSYRGMYFGLTYWTPNINIFRDPRWGRGQETYGECPYLTSRMGVAFVRGLQGDDPRHLKLVATPKHFAVHSGPESDRHWFDAKASPKDLRETYLPAFEACVREGRAMSVMGAYNRTNGEPCCGSKTLLQDILRREWGFEGYVVSDCGAICDFHNHHHLTQNAAESAALAVRNGCDLNCGETYPSLRIAVTQGLITEAEIDRAVARLMEARIRLGMFDPPETVRWASIAPEVVGCEAHRRLSREMSISSMVLLKNEGSLLPLRRETLRSILVVGPAADSTAPLVGNYNGQSPQMTTILQGIVGAAPAGMKITYLEGCKFTGGKAINPASIQFHGGDADVVIAVLGLHAGIEGEEGDAGDSDSGGDRTHLGLPERQEELLRMVAAMGKPVVLVLTGGSALSVPWAFENVPAIVMAWYPGEAGGEALAALLFGEANFSARLPVTVPRSLVDVPPFHDYAMKGRTYRYSEAEPLVPFGFGLSYTKFEYSGLAMSSDEVAAGGSVTVRVQVRNMGPVEGCEVVQLYLRDVEGSAVRPIHSLAGFRRVALAPGQSAWVDFPLGPREMSLVLEDGHRVVEPGVFQVFVGGSQPDARSQALGAPQTLQATFRVKGRLIQLA